MATRPVNPEMMLRAIGKNGILLAAFALITTAAIALTWQTTEQRIDAQQRAAAARALLEIVPATRHDNEMLEDLVPVADAAALRVDADSEIHIARLDSEVVAAIIPSVAPDGYSGRIEMRVGINRDGTIAGVRVLSHSETPGLGDKVDLKKSPWILTFNGRSLKNPTADRWAVHKDGGDFDQFTGATITPRAVIAAVHRSLTYFAAHRAALLSATTAQAQDRDDG